MKQKIMVNIMNLISFLLVCFFVMVTFPIVIVNSRLEIEEFFGLKKVLVRFHRSEVRVKVKFKHI